MKHIEIYCDGSCIGNPGPGGWAGILIYKENTKQVCGSSQDTTNNKMELTAAIESLRAIIEPSEISVFTDSKYLKDGITKWIKSWKINNWKNGTVKNIDLWKDLEEACAGHKISWNWVKAHNGNKYNEMADDIARDMAKSLCLENEVKKRIID